MRTRAASKKRKRANVYVRTRTFSVVFLKSTHLYIYSVKQRAGFCKKRVWRALVQYIIITYGCISFVSSNIYISRSLFCALMHAICQFLRFNRGALYAQPVRGGLKTYERFVRAGSGVDLTPSQRKAGSLKENYYAGGAHTARRALVALFVPACSNISSLGSCAATTVPCLSPAQRARASPPVALLYRPLLSVIFIVVIYIAVLRGNPIWQKHICMLSLVPWRWRALKTRAALYYLHVAAPHSRILYISVAARFALLCTLPHIYISTCHPWFVATPSRSYAPLRARSLCLRVFVTQ